MKGSEQNGKTYIYSAKTAEIPKNSQIVRVSEAAYNAVEEISAKTGLSNSFIASKMIEFATEHTEVVFEIDE